MQRALERARIDLVVLDVLLRRRRRPAAVPKPARRQRRALDHPGAARRRSGSHPRPRNGRGRLPRKTREFPRIAGAHAQYPAPRERRAAAGREPRAHGSSASAAGSSTSWRASSAIRRGSRATLRNSEYRVLASLLAHGNRVVSRGKLIELARGRDAGPFDRSIDVRISRLRQVLGDDARVSAHHQDSTR